MPTTTYESHEYPTGYSGLAHADIASFLQKTFTAGEQAAVTALIAEVESEISRRCDRAFKVAESQYKEVFDVPPQVDAFRTKHSPINSVVLITMEGETIYEANDNHGLKVHVYPNRLVIPEIPDPEYAERALEVTYTIKQFWGDDVKLAIKRVVGQLILNAENAGVPLITTSFGSMTETKDGQELVKHIDAVVKRYKLLNL